MTFLQLAEKVLREANKPLTPKEIWDFGDKKGYAKEVRTSGLTPWETIGARIYVDIRDNEKTKFIKVGKKSLFFLTDLIKNENTVKYETDKEYSDNNDNDDYDEKDLHKFLTYHVYSKYKIYTKTISAQKSLKKEKNSDKWRHPDIVGVYFPNWEKDIVDISKDTGSFGIKLFSYELKKELNLANLRERYFQAVSNSSWANEGYLVASEIDDNDEEFMAECKRLSSAFGIGLMKISIDDPDQSKILFQAKVKDNIDIETMNLLPKINKDFKDFITDVKADYDTYPRIRSKYDKVISTEELYK